MARAPAPGRPRDRRTTSTWSKYGSARPASSPLGERTRVAAARRDRASRPAAASLESIASASLSRRIEATIVHSARLEAREQPLDRLGRVRPVADLVAARGARAVRAARPRRRRRSGGRRTRSAASRAPPTTTWPSGTSSRHSSSGSTTVAPGRATASFSRRDLLPRVAEDVGVLEADVRQQDDGRVEDVRRVEPAAEPGLDDGCVDARARRSARTPPP